MNPWPESAKTGAALAKAGSPRAFSGSNWRELAGFWQGVRVAKIEKTSVIPNTYIMPGLDPGIHGPAADSAVRRPTGGWPWLTGSSPVMAEWVWWEDRNVGRPDMTLRRSGQIWPPADSGHPAKRPFLAADRNVRRFGRATFA